MKNFNYIEVKTENGLAFIKTDTILRIHFEENLAKIVVNNSLKGESITVIKAIETKDEILNKLN